jgi:hypothetical protein
MDDVYEARPRFRVGAFILNLLTLVVLLAALGAGLVLGAVFLNPYLPFNPYPPPTLPPTLGFPTATNTPARFLPPTWTATITATSRASETPTATITPTETLTPTLGTPDQTPAQVSYTFRADAPVAMPNSFINSEGCNWMGVGGQVFDANEAPVVLQGVHLEGELAGAPVQMDTLTGSATVLGPSGYIFDLADHPIASNQALRVQLLDQSGLPLSDPVVISTYDTCDENFILLIWRQVPE